MGGNTREREREREMYRFVSGGRCTHGTVGKADDKIVARACDFQKWFL